MTNDNTQLVALSALKVFYDASEDHIDLYSTLTLAVLEQNLRFSIDEICKKIEDSFGIKIPESMIKTTLKRLRRNTKVGYQNIRNPLVKTITITEDGIKEKNHIHKEIRKTEREENALLNDLNMFLGGTYKPKQLKIHLNSFIEKNSYVAAVTLQDHATESQAINGEIDQNIQKFFLNAEQRDQKNFDRLKNLLLAKIITSHSVTAKNKNANLSLENIIIYIDSNIFFSLLELHQDHVNRSVRATIDLIKDANGKLKIFEHTKTEICAVLKGFTKEYSNYPQNIPVDSVYSVMRRKGLNRHAVFLLIENIDSRFSEFGITVEDESYGNVIDITGDYLSKLKSAKQAQDKNIKSIENDCESIERIRQLRNRNNAYYLIEKCKALFLTADNTLSKFSRNLHEDTIQEVVNYEQLTAILWLRNVGAAENTFAHNFLSHNVTLKVISKDLWMKFITKLQHEKNNGILNQQGIDQLLSLQSTQSILLDKGESGIDSIINDQNINREINNKKKLEALNQRFESERKENKVLKTATAKRKANIKCACITLISLVTGLIVAYFGWVYGVDMQLIFAVVAISLIPIGLFLPSEKIPRKIHEWIPKCIFGYREKMIAELVQEYTSETSKSNVETDKTETL